jgi:hypothetical protein
MGGAACLGEEDVLLAALLLHEEEDTLWASSSNGSPRRSSSERNAVGRSVSSLSRELRRGQEGNAHVAPWLWLEPDVMSMAEEERVELIEL